MDSDPTPPIPLRIPPEGPARRWRWLAMWVACIAAIIAAQWRMAGTFPTGHWTPDGNTPATTPELLWYRLPLVGLVLLFAGFFVGLRWWVPEKRTRSMIRAWGFFFTFWALLLWLGTCVWYGFFWYMD